MCRLLSLSVYLSHSLSVYLLSSFISSMIFSCVHCYCWNSKVWLFYSFKEKKKWYKIVTRAINWSRCVFHHQSVMSWARVFVCMGVCLCICMNLNRFSCSQTGKIFHCDNELFWQMSHQIQWIFCFGEEKKTFPTSKNSTLTCFIEHFLTI